MARPLISRRDTWKRFRNNITSLIREALLILRARADLVEDEKPLNRALRKSFIVANDTLGFDYFPALDAENETDDIETEGSKPDFTWSFYNDQAERAEDCERSFALECKRLGEPTGKSKSWVLTEQYVKSGLLRFFQEEKGYSRNCAQGAMVGYIQNMDFDKILREINISITSAGTSIPVLASPIGGWQYSNVSLMQHSFIRSFPLPIIFLDHFWLDLRDRYPSLASRTAVSTEHVADEEVSLVALLKNINDSQHSIPASSESIAQLQFPGDQNN